MPDFAYLALAERIARRVQAGTLRPGTRLPSVRELAAREGVSVNTVRRAYEELELRGRVRKRDRAGHFVAPARRAPTPPMAVEVEDRVAAFIASMRGQTLSFGAATLDPSLVPFGRLNRALSRVARDAGAYATGYDEPAGHLGLRRLLAARLGEIGVDAHVDEIVVAVGAIEALGLALAAVACPGDSVVVESPCYFGILGLLERLSLRAVVVSPLVDDAALGALAAVLEAQPVRACALVPNYSNPTGRLMPTGIKARLAALARTHDVDLVESDVYGDLHHGARRPEPLKAHDPDGRVLYCGSFSKTLAAGWRVGWLVPGRAHAAVLRGKFATTVATPIVLQMALADFLESGGYARHLRTLRPQLARSATLAREALLETLPPGSTVSSPEGGFLLWAELPEGFSGDRLQARALGAGLSVAPGPMFSASGGLERCFRVSVAHPWTEAVGDDLRRLARLAGREEVEATQGVRAP